jgi:gliding motility-associated-like protein
VGSTTVFSISGNSATGTFSSSNNNVATVNPTTGLINALSSGTANILYTVLGTNGCDDVTASRTINISNKPVAGTLSGNQNICLGGSTVFSISGNSATGTFSSSNNGVAIVNSITGVINAVSTGTANIIYTVSGNNGCADSSTSRIINIFETPVAGTLSGNQNICVGGNTVFSVSGNSTTGTFTSSNNNIAIVNAITGEVSGISQGTAVITYTVQGTGGCPNNIASRTITVSEPINISAISGLDNICIGSTNNIYTATPNGGTWSVNNTNIATINPSSGVVTALASDTTSIIYTVAGVGGCPSQTISKKINIVEPPVVSNLSKIKNVTCNGGNDGSIEIVITSGNPPYTTLWSPGNETGLEIFNLTSGTYTLQISDTFGCSKQYQFNITEPLPITLSATITEPLCFGNSTGSINLNVVNINIPASYIWSPSGSTTQNITNISAGTYNVTVTDNNDCQQTLSVNLTQPNELLLNSIVTNVSCYNGNDANIEVITSGGTPNYTYIWSINNANGNNLSNLPSGSYAVTVIDANGCQKTETAIIESPQPVAVRASNDTVIAIGYSVSLEVVNTTGGTPSYNYNWQPENTLNTPFGTLVTAKPTENTTYIVTATDNNGCVGFDTVFVRVDVKLYDFPDGFTPNGDGLNDYFNIIKSPIVDLIEFQIFNRWGQLIYNANNTNGWDGRFNGVLQPMDTYVYQALVQLPDGKRENALGNFILVR